MELYIIRHGETDFNKRGIIQGRGVNSDLNDHGISQARSFYKAYHHIEFDKVITSTLKRTHQTVQSFIDKGIPWEQYEGLDELDWGINEVKEATKKLKDDFSSLTKNWMDGKIHDKFPGGESPVEVNERQVIALNKILREQDQIQNVLICMHGRALRLLLCHMLQLPLNNMDTFPHSNVSLYRLKYNNGIFEMLDFNNTDHFHA